MIDPENLPFSEKMLQWELSLEHVQDIFEYDELNEEYSKLKSKVLNRKEISDEDDVKFFGLIKTQWKWIIRDGADELLGKIKNRKTKGQNFTEIVREINTVKVKGQKNFSLEVYEKLYSDLKRLSEDTKEKIDIERYESQQFWRGLLYGGIIGAVLGAIISYFLK